MLVGVNLTTNSPEMTDKEQTQQLADELDKLLNRFADEYDLSFASAVGVLQMKIHNLCQQAREESEDETG